jgi:hypothetical protein
MRSNNTKANNQLAHLETHIHQGQQQHLSKQPACTSRNTYLPSAETAPKQTTCLHFEQLKNTMRRNNNKANNPLAHPETHIQQAQQQHLNEQPA